MRKLLLSLCAVAAMTASAQDKQLVRIDTYSITTDEATGAETSMLTQSSATNYYDATNTKVMDQSNYLRTFYTYNDKGQVVATEGHSWSDATGWTASEGNNRTYEYDAEGNLVKSSTTTGCTVYSGYQHGEYAKMENCSADGTPYYTAQYRLTFDEQNHLTVRETLGLDGETVQQIQRYTYTADGKLATTHQAYIDADGNESTTNYTDEAYSYNADGSIDKIRVVSNGRWGLMTSDQVYVYATYAAAYVPQNVKAEAGAANTVTVTWDAVSGATKYVVIYDQQAAEVEGTSLTTGTLLDGEHSFYVQAVIGGEAKNISAAATASVKDTGKLAAENFKVLDVEVGENDWGGKAYLVKVQFTLPEGHSEITGYKLFYGEGNWDKADVAVADATVEGNTVTITGSLGEYAVSDYDTETYEYVPRSYVELSVVISYATGDAERSNTAAWNFAANESSISAAAAEANVAAVYTLSGVKASAVQRGINIVRMTDGSVKKVMVK